MIVPRMLSAQVSWAHLSPQGFRYIPCPLCGNFNYNTIGSLIINWSEFFLVKCCTCSLIWRNPIPDDKFLNDLYSEKYFDVRSYPMDLIDQVGIADQDEHDQLSRRKLTQDEVRRWMIENRISPTDQLGKPRKLLEIGGGRGYLQRAAAEAGWTTLGLEISPHGIKEAIDRKMMVIPVTLNELCSKYVPYLMYFDLIVFFDFLEHVSDPGSVLRMVHSILRDDGTIILRIPALSSDSQELVPKYHLIDHIWHFSQETIEHLLEKEHFKIQKLVPSGRFPTADGQIQNFTIYATKN